MNRAANTLVACPRSCAALFNSAIVSDGSHTSIRCSTPSRRPLQRACLSAIVAGEFFIRRDISSLFIFVTGNEYMIRQNLLNWRKLKMLYEIISD